MNHRYQIGQFEQGKAPRCGCGMKRDKHGNCVVGEKVYDDKGNAIDFQKHANIGKKKRLFRRRGAVNA